MARPDASSETIWRDHFESAPVPLAVWRIVVRKRRRTVVLEAVNRAGERVLGGPREQFIGLEMDAVVPHVPRVVIQKNVRQMVALKRGKPIGYLDYVGDPQLAAGTYRIYAFPMPHQRVGFAVQDATAEHRERAARERTQQRLASLLERVPVGIASGAGALHIREANETLCALLGMSGAELAGAGLAACFVGEEARARYLGLAELGGSAELEMRRADGATLWVQVSATRRPEGEEDQRLLLALLDITGRRVAEARYQHLAYYDAVTGLPNRALFLDRLAQSVARVARQRRLVAVLYVNLDRFKVLNDSLGHRAGDRLLKAVAERLSASVRVGDTVARLGGDEFGVILADVASPRDVADVAGRMVNVVEVPVAYEGHEFTTTASVGIALAPEDGTTAEGLLRNADAALHQAKAEGRNGFRFYSRDLNRRARAQLSLESGLRAALRGDEFELHYQPILELATQRLTGLEALLRWQRPGTGLVMPADFIALLEETGLILDVGRWVVAQVVRQIAEWQREQRAPVPVSFNVSALQFRDADLPGHIERLLEQHGVAADRLKVELTESVLIADPALAAERLRRLRELGIGVAIDDFGTGHSALSYITRFPVSAIKIDRTFVHQLTRSQSDLVVVRAALRMAEDLKLDSIAEGVETQAQLDILQAAGCGYGQGYLFARPMPAAQVAGLLPAAAPRRVRSRAARR